jgi:hypothetical protein
MTWIPSSARHPDGASIPAWCDCRRGKRPLLLVAPHGGRRAPIDPSAPPPHLRVNDVYTPEVTHLLAERLQAGAIVNTGMDRNLLDLNRTSQIRRRAPWYLPLLAREIGALIGRHGSAEVIFVHGWNTGQAKCDLGVGARETTQGLAVCAGAKLTVRPHYWQHRLEPLRAAWERVGIRALVGVRYPAGHPNNLVQLFTEHDRHQDDAAVRQIAAWAAAGRVNAWQLELGIPLRWPGPWRERLLEGMARVFELRSAARHDDVALPLAKTPVASVVPPVTLQFYDAVSDVGMLAGSGPLGAHAVGARLLFFLGGQRVALFTGEERREFAGDVVPLRWRLTGRGLRLHFSGPMLLLDDAAAYLDLEAALAQSRLVDAHVDLEFLQQSAAAGSRECGVLRGRVVVDGTGHRIEARAFVHSGPLRMGGARQMSLHGDFGGHGALSARGPVSTEIEAVHIAPTEARRLPLSGNVTLAGDGYSPVRLEWKSTRGPAVEAWPVSRMAILRGNGAGHYVRITFGVARMRWGDREGFGLYEYSAPVR